MTNVLDFDDDPLRTIRSGRFRTFRFPAFIGRGVGDLIAPSAPAPVTTAPVAGLRDVFAGRSSLGDDDDEAGLEPGDRTRSDINVGDLTNAQLNEALTEIAGPRGIGARAFSALGRGLMGLAFPGGSFIAGAFQSARRSDLVAEGLARGNQLARDLNNAAGATGFGGPGFDPGGFDPGPPGGGGFGGPDDPGMEEEEEGTPSDPGQDPEGGFGDEETEGSPGGGFGGPDDEGIGDDDPSGGEEEEDTGGGFGGPDDEGINGDEEDEEDEEDGGEDEDEDEDDESEDEGGEDEDDEGGFHRGGLVVGPDPHRVGEDVRATVQEGEFILPRATVGRLGGPSRLREVIAGEGGGGPAPVLTNQPSGGSTFNPAPGAGQDTPFTSPAIQGSAASPATTNPNTGLTAPEQAELMAALTPRVTELLGRLFASQGREFPLGPVPGQTVGVPFKAIPQGPALSGLRRVA